MEKRTLRIVKKSREGVTLKAKGVEPCTCTWDEFNASYVIDENDKFLAVMKPEAQEEFEKKLEHAEEVISDIVVCVLGCESPNLEVKFSNLAALSGKMENASKDLGLSLEQIMDIVRRRTNQFKNSAFSKGWMKKKKETPEEYKARKEREKQTVPTERTTSSLGDLDALKDLKESFKS